MTSRTIQQLDPATVIVPGADRVPLGQADGTTKGATVAQILTGYDSVSSPYVTTYVPVVQQGAPITLSTVNTRWRKTGDSVDYMGQLVMNGTGTLNATISISMPVFGAFSQAIGSALMAKGGTAADAGLFCRPAGNNVLLHINLGSFYGISGAGQQILPGWELWFGFRYSIA